MPRERKIALNVKTRGHGMMKREISTFAPARCEERHTFPQEKP
jgi:hypothetical protein